MARFFPRANAEAGHPLRRLLRPPQARPAPPVVRNPREDLAFFLVSFASAFVILYGFII